MKFTNVSGTKYSRKSVSNVREKHMVIPVIKAITWFLVSDDAKIPMALNAAPRSIPPVYPPTTGPQSSFPKKDTEIAYKRVGVNITAMNAMDAKNFPRMISLNSTGKVRSIS